MARRTLVVYLDRRGEYRWRLVASNGRIVADSGEGYRRGARARQAGLKLFPDAVVETDFG